MPDISGATSSRFTPGAAQVGKRVRVRVTGVGADGKRVTVSTPWVGPIKQAVTSPRRSAVMLDDPIAYFPLDGDTGDVVAGHTLTPFGSGPQSLGSEYRFGGAGYLRKVLTDGPAVPRGATSATGRDWDDLLAATDRLTVEAWVRGSTPTVSTWQAVTQMIRGNHGFALQLVTTAGSQTCWVRGYVGSGTAQVVAQVNFTDFLNDTWRHIAMTYDGANVRLFVGGAQVAITAYTGAVSMSRAAAPTPEFSIGGGQGGAVAFDYLLADVADVAVYGYAVSAARLAAHASASSTLTTGSDPLPHYPPRALPNVAYSSHGWLDRYTDGATERAPTTLNIQRSKGTLMIASTPSGAEEIVFWAMQLFFYDASGVEIGGAHMGLQWNVAYPNSRAVNFGGYTSAGALLSGTTSQFPSTPGDANTRDYNWATNTPYAFEMWISAAGQVSASINGQLIRVLTVPGVARLGEPLVFVEDFRSFHETNTVAEWDGLIVNETATTDWYANQVSVNYQANHTWRHPYRDVSVVGDAVRFRSPGVRTTTDGQLIAITTPVSAPAAPTATTLPTASGLAREGSTVSATSGNYNDATTIASQWVSLTAAFPGGDASNFTGTITPLGITTPNLDLSASHIDAHVAFRQVVTGPGGTLTVLSNSLGPVEAADAVVQPLVSDSFSKADTDAGLGATDTGQTWTILHAPQNFGISGGRAYKADVAIAETADVVDAGTRDVRLSGIVTLGASGNIDAGYALRAISPSTYLVASLVRQPAGFAQAAVDTIGLYLRSGGTSTPLSTVTNAGLNHGQAYTLEVIANGPSIIVKLDGQERINRILTTQEEAAVTGTGDTRHGLRSNNDTGASTRIDAFAIYPVSALSPPANSLAPVLSSGATPPVVGVPVTRAQGIWENHTDIEGQWEVSVGVGTPAPAPTSQPVVTTGLPPVIGTQLGAQAGTWSDATNIAHQWEIESTIPATQPPVPATQPQFTGGIPPRIDQQVTAVAGSWSNADTLSHQWEYEEVANVPVPPTFVSAPTVSGTATEGNNLTSSVGDYNGETAITGEWVQLSTSFAGGLASNFTGTVTPLGDTDNTFGLTAAHVGQYIAYRETASNADGSVVAISASVGPIAQAPIVSDTFTRANSTTSLGTSTSGHIWTLLTTGTNLNHGIISNQAYKADTVDGTALDVVNAGTKNVRVVVDVTMGTTRANPGLGLRCIDFNTFVLVSLVKRSDKDAIDLYIEDNGTFHLLNTLNPAGLVHGASYRLEATLADTTGGAASLTATLYNPTTGAVFKTVTGDIPSNLNSIFTGTNVNRHGLKSGNENGTSRYDNFAIYSA